MFLNNSQFPRQFTISSATSHFCSMCAETKLNPPHGFNELCLPLFDPLKREFFAKCAEHDDFHRTTSEREQVHLLFQWSQMQSITQISLQDIADFLGVNKGTIAWHLSKPFHPGQPCEPLRGGRPSVIPDEVLQQLARYIQDAFDIHVPVTYEDLRDHLLTEFELQIQSDTLRKFVRRSPLFRVVRGIPMEDSRLFSSPQKIDEYFDRISEVIEVGTIPSAFIINLDEAGFDSYVDARKIKRVVPASFLEREIPTPVSRQEKRATLLAAVCADGYCLRPMVVLQRGTVERELLDLGYTDQVVAYGHSETGFMNSSLFLQWAERSFFPEIRQRRALLGYEGPALLIMDGFNVHTSSAFDVLCEEANVVKILIPPHTSDQLQPCDLGLFAVMKRWQSNISLPPDLNKQTKQIVRMLDSLRMATTPKNVIGAFRKAGIVGQFSIEKGTMLATVDRSQATAVRHFQHQNPVEEQGVNPKERIRI